jgi:hypothetical protein
MCTLAVCVLTACHGPAPPPPPRARARAAGSPRAYSIPDRFHPEDDGAPPRTRQTVLQQHVEFFDYDKDGVIWPWDTARGAASGCSAACPPCIAARCRALPQGARLRVPASHRGNPVTRTHAPSPSSAPTPTPTPTPTPHQASVR